MQQLGDLDQLENLLRGATNPGALAEVDLDRARELLGDDAANSLERMAELTKMLEDAGLIENKEGRFELTPRGIRRIGQNALHDLFKKLERRQARPARAAALAASGHEREYDTKPYEFGDPFNLHIERTVRNAVRRSGGGTPVRLTPDDFEVERTEQMVRSSTVLMLDLSLSMPMRDNFLPAKKVAMALHSLISTTFPRDYLGIVGFSEVARELAGRAAARGLVGLRLRHQHAARLPDRPPPAGPPERHQADHHDHRRRADGPHHGLGRGVLQLPAGARDRRGDPARGGPLHPRRASASTPSCSTRRTTSSRSSRSSRQMNRGRAFFTTPETLGDYVLVDFIEQKRKLLRGRRAG